ncbi:carboxypeptidase M32 [Bacillus marinisedimentorum]|uniref:carboxypeptidase M32 n=1 Tax=Bacillus marinisedimentorum TaxID=1821260 RepID=UPI0007DF9DFB|nr:carboxypeptidase M32 [Bacillus marinisedimentorum]
MAEEMTKLEEGYTLLAKKIAAYNEALSLIFWDLRTGAPKKGTEQRAEVIGMISSEIHRLQTSDEMGTYIEKLSDGEIYGQLSEITKKSLKESKKDYDRNRKIPADEYREYTVLQSRAETVWEEARANADFGMFRPYLEKLVEFNKKFIGYWGFEGNKYNTLLDLFEPGITVDMIDNVFGELRERIVPLVEDIADAEAKPETGFLFSPFPKEKQRQFSLHVLKEMGYDFEAGRLDETVHPFAIGLNPGDVRVTTRYDEKDFRTAVFGTIHEGGHALYEQNISEELAGTPLSGGTSMGIHESQSLFWENFVSRNHSFWKRHYTELQKVASPQFDHVSLDDFYRAINESRPSLIRIEADELTYPLHVMVRYEIEKGLFNDEIEVKDLPRIWNEKMEEYLGVTPAHDGEGVLQDVHWAGGMFGYFPSYALGYIYAAQLNQAMLKDLPEFDELLEKGEFMKVKDWLTEHVHRHGKMKEPLEIMKEATGGQLDAKPLIEYLEDKYRKIYNL